MKRAAWLTAVLVLAAGVAPVRGDMPGPFPSPSRNRHLPAEVREEKPKRSGPFRSCGSGAPLALVGIAATWGMLWLGHRFAGRVSRRESR